ncbi:MAG: DNA/RNA non-specific endonuclease, partial [Cyanobacteria bacterium J06631_2]
MRFDLHVPDVEEFTPGIEYPDLKVFMKGNEPDAQEYELSSRIVAKAGVSRTGQRIKGIEIAFDDDFANPGYADNRIGFGSGGFETFTLDIPDELRGKVSTLRFELGNGYKDEVYLDNVFFQSQHLQLGNPTDARIQYEPYPADGLTENHNDNRENFLVEKPQYTISYNDTTKNPKWVSWQLNRSWLGAESRTEAFEQDHTLPSNWDKVQGSGDINGNSDSTPLREKHVRGHLAPSGDRTRNEKDNYATFLMSNIVPQNQENNSDLPRARWWLGLEQFSRKLVQGGKELYIIAGGQGQKSTLDARSGDFKINVPERLWKVIVVMDKPGQTIADVDEGTMAFAIDIPNINPVDDPINPNDWKDYVIPVQTLENRLGTTEYDFLSNIPTEIQKKIESRDRNEILNWINSSNLSSPLLAAPDTSIGHDSFIKDNSSTRTGVKLFNSSQVNVTEVSVSETGLADSSIVKNSASEIDPLEITLAKTGIAEIDSIHITIPTKATFIHTSPTKTGKAQVSFIEPASNETGIAKISSVIDTSYNDIINPISSDKTLSSEIPFAPSVESEQFFSIHNSKTNTNNVSNKINQADSDTISTETTIGHDSFIEDNAIESHFIESFNSAQVSPAQINITKSNFTKSSISEDSLSEINVIEEDLPEFSVSKVNPSHEAIFKTALKHTDSAEIGKAQVNLDKRAAIELGFTEVGFPIDSASDSLVSQPPETLPSEILFASSVESEQFFSIHNSKTNNVSNNINQADSDTIST